jgi:hypothetical protein
VVATLALTAVVVRHPPGLTADERCLVVTNGLKERTLRRSEIERFAVDTRWGRNRVLCAHLRSGAVVRLEVTSVLFSYWSTSRGARLERALSAWLRNDRPGAPTP